MLAYACLLVFFVLEYVRPTSYVPALIPLHLNLLVPLAAVGAALFYRPRTAGQKAGTDWSLPIMGVFVLLLVVSRFTAFISGAAQAVLENVVGYVVIAWVITRTVDSERRIRGVFAILVLVHVTIMGLSPEMLLDPSSRAHGIASGSFLGDGNDFALSLVIVLPLCLYLLFTSRGAMRRSLLILGMAVLLAGVVASQSRGATIALVVVGLHYWFNSGRNLVMAAIAGAAVVVILVAAPDSYFARLSTISNPTDGSAQGRITSWKAAWAEALKNPLLGVGAGNTPYMHRQNPHSIYFMALGELGFPGLFALLALIVWNLGANRRLIHEWRGPRAGPGTQRQLLAATSASMIAFATAGAFLSATYYPHAYIVAGLLTACRRVVRSTSPATVATPAPAPAITYHWALAPGPKQLS